MIIEKNIELSCIDLHVSPFEYLTISSALKQYAEKIGNPDVLVKEAMQMREVMRID